jgi:hypothetical protein
MKKSSNSLAQTLLRKIGRITVVTGFYFINNVGSNILCAKLAEDLDWQEIGKIVTSWNRSIYDIQKTMSTQPQPTSFTSTQVKS